MTAINTKQALVPKLRFNEFKDEWDSQLMGNIVSKVGSGSTPSGGVQVYQKTGIPFIRSQNVTGNELVLDETHISESVNLKMKGSIVKPHDILLNITGGSIGRTCVVPSDFDIGNVNQHVCIIRLKSDYTPRFVQPFLASYKGQKLLYQGMTGSGREGINFQSIRLFKLNLPSLPEQQKIASFLSVIDEKIQQLAKKKELLEHYKKGAMQQVFSKKLRFKDAEGKDFPDWEEKILGDVAIKKSSNISANNIEDNFGEYIIYGASGILKKISFYKEENDYISIVKDGAGVGRLLYCKGKSSVLGTMEMIIPKNEIHPYFLYCLLSNIDFVKYVTGSTIPHIYFKDYSSESCGIPCLKEQQKIASFLFTIEKKIEAVNQQLTQSQTFKKGLLQQMFV